MSGTDGGAIYEYDERSEEFHLRATDHMEEELITALRANPPHLGDGVVGRAAASREPVVVPNILEERAYAPRMRQMLERFGFRASLAVPLLREDRIIGGLGGAQKVHRRVSPRSDRAVEDLRHSICLSHPKCPSVPRDRGKEPADRSRQPAQVGVPGQHVARAAHAAQRHHRLLRSLQERLFGELNEKQAEYTDDILTSGRHLLSLINEILDLSKVEAGRMELESLLRSALAIDNARTFVRERATNHGINLDVVVDERLGLHLVGRGNRTDSSRRLPGDAVKSS